MNSEIMAAYSDYYGMGNNRQLTGKEGRSADTKRYLLLSFFVPCFLVGICWILQGVHPFGSRQILVTDFWHQYFPFANILHEKLQSFSSLLYTWESGLGSDFIAMMAYYAASPLNLLTIFIPDAFLRDGLTLILLLKIGFAGLFTGMLLKYTFRRNDISLCFFSSLYALCSFILGYSWNIIWIDTVALLPLVMLGVMKIVCEKKCSLYTIALALSLISNYYIGLFICIFTVIAFFCICLFRCTGFKHFIFSGFRISAATAVGAGLASFILIPAYFALQLTNSADNTFPSEISFYEEWLDILANISAFREPTVKEGLPNLYCGVICVPLAGMFLSSKKVSFREKIAALLVLAFIIVSCNMNILNFIWHGFHVTNMLPYRFSFLFSFVMVIMAYRAFDLVLSGGIRFSDSIAMAVFAAGLFAVTWYSERTDKQTDAMWLSFAVSLFYVLVMFLYERKLFKPFAMCAVLSVGLLFEMFVHVRTSTEAVGTSDYVSYPTKSTEVSKLLDEIKNMDDDLFSRTEMSTWYTLNDPALYSYNGVSQFSSMANKNVTTFLKSIGLPGSEAGNRYYYALSSPLTNMFTGIKYIISRNGAVLDTKTLRLVAGEDSVMAYRNKYSLPIGFMTDEDVLTYDSHMYSNPFDAQNALFSKATGIDEPLFMPIDVTHTAHEGMAEGRGVYRNGYGNYSFTADQEADSHTFKFNFVPEKDSVLYAYFWADGVSNVQILHDNVNMGNYSVTKQQGFIAPIGSCNAGVKATVSADIKDENVKSGTLRIYVCSLNMNLLEQGYQKLAAGAIDLEEFSDTGMTGTVNAENDGLCYFSIPQENGWTAYVNGEKTETETVGGAMLAVPVKKGIHTVKLKYVPEGFTEGIIITLVSFIILIAVLLKEYKFVYRIKQRVQHKEKRV